MSDVSISDVCLALLVLDQERDRNAVELERLEAQMKALQEQERLLLNRNRAIDETIKRVRSAA